MLLLSDQPFKPGDWISAGDNEGVVVDINWRTSRIRTRNGDMVIVPNSELAGASIVNYSSPDPLHRVTVQLTVAYANPPTLAKEMLLDAARNTPGVLEDPPPFVAVWQIDDPLMGYEVQMWVDDYAIGPRVKTDFGTLVWYQSFRHDVPLPSPAQDLYLWDGVKNAEDSVPTMAEVRSKLSAAHLLSSLADDDVDRLTHASRLARFSIGEVLLDSSAPATHLIILVEGRAMLHVDDRAGTTSPVAEINEGEILGLLHSTTATGYDVFARAEDDCVVLMIDSDVAGEVASRNPELSDALNRTTSIRRRRTERALENRTVISASAHDVTTEVEAEGDSNGGDQP
jgi:CRP-like cAMP-binding protein